MKLTVIVAEIGAACNIGGPITYRRITVDLTPEQAAALALHDKWDSHGTTFIELDEADRVCTCGTVSGPRATDTNGRCYRCGKVPSASPPDDRGRDPGEGA